MKTHRELYPEQYSHALVGEFVAVHSTIHDAPLLALGHVERVVNTRFGKLAILVGDGKQAWAAKDCKPVE